MFFGCVIVAFVSPRATLLLLLSFATPTPVGDGIPCPANFIKPARHPPPPPPPKDYDGQPLRHAEQKDVNEFCTHLLHKLEGSSKEAGSLIDRVFGGTLVYQIISRCAILTRNHHLVQF